MVSWLGVESNPKVRLMIDLASRKACNKSPVVIRVALTITVWVFVTADLATKYWAGISPMTVHGPTEILPFLSLVLAYNPGITFGGIFGIAGNPALVTTAISAACLALVIWLCREHRTKAKFLIALAFAGALGNTIDRLVNTMVTDFLQLRFGGAFTLVINLADIWIVTSIIGLMLLGRRSG